MEVNDPDVDAFEYATHAQLWDRELGKVEAFIHGGHRGKYLQLEELRSPGICQSIHMKVIASRKLHTDKLMISEVMSFVCLDSYENGITKEKVYTKGSGKLPFQSISGSKAMDWNFLRVKYLD